MNGLMMALLGGTGGVGPQAVFSADLYTGDASSRTIFNGIDLLGDGGMVWIKARGASTSHKLVDTVRGATKAWSSDNIDVEVTDANGLTAFNTSGFSLGNDANYNASGVNFISWTFKRTEKFFDVVQYTGNGTVRTISHGLGIKPGLIISRRTETAAVANYVYHQSRGATKYLKLDTTEAEVSDSSIWNSEPTASDFSVGSIAQINETNRDYIAYLFAHDISEDGVIRIGEFTGNGSSTGPVITLGWQPQWLLFKDRGSSGNWFLFDTERGIINGGNDAFLSPDYVGSENANLQIVDLTSDGFQMKHATTLNGNGRQIIYMAIRKPT